MMTCLFLSLFPSLPQCSPVFSTRDNSWQDACSTMGDPLTPLSSCQSSVSSRPVTMSVMTCTICAETITDRAMKAGDKLYHEEHFTCTKCGTSLAGAEVAIYTRQESLYCQDCYMALFVPVCARCNQYITQVAQTISTSPRSEYISRSNT